MKDSADTATPKRYTMKQLSLDAGLYKFQYINAEDHDRIVAALQAKHDKTEQELFAISQDDGKKDRAIDTLRAQLAEAETKAGVAEQWHDKAIEWSRLNAELKGRLAQTDEWRERVIDALIVNHIYSKEHDTDPRKALSDLIAWENKIALDPAVSPDAQKLIDVGMGAGGRLRSIDEHLFAIAKEDVVRAQANRLGRLHEAVQLVIEFYSLDTEHFVAKYGPGVTTKALCDRLREFLK